MGHSGRFAPLFVIGAARRARGTACPRARSGQGGGTPGLRPAGYRRRADAQDDRVAFRRLQGHRKARFRKPEKTKSAKKRPFFGLRTSEFTEMRAAALFFLTEPQHSTSILFRLLIFEKPQPAPSNLTLVHLPPRAVPYHWRIDSWHAISIPSHSDL